MQKKKIAIGAAGVGVLLAGIVSAANLDVSAADGTLAAGEVTVSGATLAKVEFTLDDTGRNLDKLTMAFTTPDEEPVVGASVAATIGSATATAATNDKGVAEVDVDPIAVEDVKTIKVVVAS
ncbi:MAG: hypothetical protein OEU98_04510 [Actinomycetota bacterium]|nr:hypothetical protein [Actinomycetota bacterium]